MTDLSEEVVHTVHEHAAILNTVALCLSVVLLEELWWRGLHWRPGRQTLNRAAQQMQKTQYNLGVNIKKFQHNTFLC